MPYPAANKHLQSRLHQFVTKGNKVLFCFCSSIAFFVGLLDNQSISNFDKVNSNRIYTLEKQNDTIQLMVEIMEKDQATSLFLLQSKIEFIQFFFIEKLVVLPIDDEIKLIVASFTKTFEQTGFIESAPKCHKRLRDMYAISDARIRIIQRIM